MTRKLIFVAGVASLALTVPANAQRGDNRDREARTQSNQSGQDRKAQRAQRAERPQRVERQRAERPQQVERQRPQRAERPQRVERQRIQRAERPAQFERQRIQRAERPQQVQRAERAQQVQRQRAERPQQVQRAERPQRVDRQLERRQALSRDIRVNVDQRRAQRADGSRDLRSPQRFSRRFVDRPVRQMTFKPTQRTVSIGERINPNRFSNFVPRSYRARYSDTRDHYYRYDNDRGYLYRIARGDNRVSALIPLFGGYGMGDPWPRAYYSSYVPLGYQGRYYDTPDYYYRNDGYGIYRIDAGTQLITALVALVTGQGFGIGQTLSGGYSAYNVPMAYRSTYFDRDDAWYRYGDGFIYEVDPYTRRIEDRYPIHAAGYDYMIGEPWPVAYPGYNVPYGYQSVYYDTPDSHYRYANGAIYQVDPTTQLIQALAALVTGQQFAVGQALPQAYSAYNVPIAHRDRYYDQDDQWYRYANGVIYRVDPYSGLIEEAIPVYA